MSVTYRIQCLKKPEACTWYEHRAIPGRAIQYNLPCCQNTPLSLQKPVVIQQAFSQHYQNIDLELQTRSTMLSVMKWNHEGFILIKYSQILQELFFLAQVRLMYSNLVIDVWAQPEHLVKKKDGSRFWIGWVRCQILTWSCSKMVIFFAFWVQKARRKIVITWEVMFAHKQTAWKQHVLSPQKQPEGRASTFTIIQGRIKKVDKTTKK